MSVISLTKEEINDSATRIGKPAYKKMQRTLFDELDYLSRKGNLSLKDIMEIMLTALASFNGCMLHILKEIHLQNIGKQMNMHGLIDYMAEELKQRFPHEDERVN